jgi:hypothetical protein
MQTPVAFDAWKARLRADCVRQDKLLAYDTLGDYVLAILWRQGIEPTVEGIAMTEGIATPGGKTNGKDKGSLA